MCQYSEDSNDAFALKFTVITNHSKQQHQQQQQPPPPTYDRPAIIQRSKSMISHECLSIVPVETGFVTVPSALDLIRTATYTSTSSLLACKNESRSKDSSDSSERSVFSSGDSSERSIFSSKDSSESSEHSSSDGNESDGNSDRIAPTTNGIVRPTVILVPASVSSLNPSKATVCSLLNALSSMKAVVVLCLVRGLCMYACMYYVSYIYNMWIPFMKRVCVFYVKCICD